MIRLKNLLKEFTDLEMIDFPTFTFNGIAYHGTVARDGVIDEFELGWSDFDAVWFAEHQYIAEEFSNRMGSNDVRVVYKCEIDINNGVRILYETYEEIISYGIHDDLRMYIDDFKRMGYDGWKTMGSLGAKEYMDIAVFYPRDSIYIKGGKAFIDGDWTSYKPISELREMI